MGPGCLRVINPGGLDARALNEWLLRVERRSRNIEEECKGGKEERWKERLRASFEILIRGGRRE